MHFPLSSLKSRHPRAFRLLKDLNSLLSRTMEIASAGENQNAPPPELPFDPLVPGVPVSYPLRTLDELESRAYFDSFHFPFNVATVKLPSGGGGAELPKRRRVLVCHDMAGGYTDDRFVQGGGNDDSYAIFHWYLIDVFVYFSHSLVTLPPACWTNAAHKHGVKSLGTFIMEWDEGRKFADKLLLTKDSARMYAERLSELAAALGFDGWLINMEVALDPGQILNLKEFVSHLSQIMHSSVPGSLIIWYDSVTIDGDLSWQNQLNDKNKPFFDICDGIFINYTWKEDFPKLSADAAGDRKFDVYMGIDVFGRGTYGGGQWTTNVALEVIKKDEVSAAIFAPGWVYETKQPPDFQTAQNRWWGLVEKSWELVQKYPKVLPFYSNFDQGHGLHVYVNGKQVSNVPWNNISSQSFQPFIEFFEESTTTPIRASIDFEDASYNGGGSISFRGTLGDDAEFTIRLFRGEVLFGNFPVRFTYSVKSNSNSLIGLALLFSSSTKEESVFIASSGNTMLTMNQFSRRYTSLIMPHKVTTLNEEPEWVMQETSIDMRGQVLREIRAVCYRLKLEKTLFRAPSEFYAALGDIKISTSMEDSKFPPASSWSVDGQFISWKLDSQGSNSKLVSLKVSWELKEGKADMFPTYNIYVETKKKLESGNENAVDELDPADAPRYLGVAAVRSFYISELEVPRGVSQLKFVIQASMLDGTLQKIEDAPFFPLKVQ